jgi:hypothetical protein
MIWSEIRADYVDENIVHVDAWLTDDDNEAGAVIAKVNIDSGIITYLDPRAEHDKQVQEIIIETLVEYNLI